MVKHSSLINAKIARRYAKSLFELALQTNSLETLEKQLSNVNLLFEQNKSLVKALKCPTCTKERMQHLIYVISTELFGQVDDKNIIYKFLNILVKNGRLSIFINIYKAFQKLLLEMRKQLDVEVVTASELSNDEKNELCSSLKEFVNKSILLTTRIDKSIIGGFIVNFDSYQIDESISTKLKSLKFALKEVS